MSASSLPVSDTLRVYDNVIQAIGHTPLIRLGRIGRGLACPLYAKVESFNPGGSVKDRIGVSIIEEAERSGRLKPGGTVVEATSGNTGVGLAIACALKGYQCIFVLADKQSQEKIQLLRAYGARVVICPTAVEPDDPRSYYSVSKRLAAETPNAILANQYYNPENPASHYRTTGPEIWEQTGGQVTDVIIAMGTGGTITGVGRYLKERNPAIRMVGIDVVGSILQETWQQGRVPADARPFAYKVEGIGEDFLPGTLDLSMVDEVLCVGDKESFLWARRLLREEGLFCGGSSGTALAGALKYAAGLPADRLPVVLLPDSGSRYLSKFYDDKWMRENGFLAGEWSEVSLGDILRRNGQERLITARPEDSIAEVIALLKANDISQVPALGPSGHISGVVTEVNLLKHLLDGGRPDGPIAPAIQPAQAVYPPETPLEEVLPALLDGQAVLVQKGDQAAGILTKIDVLDTIAHRI